MKAIRWAKGLEKLLVPIDSIKQHPKNPNNGDVEEIIDSIKINGFNTVITVDNATGEILAGNHRLQALLALGAKEAPVVWVDRQEADGDIRYLIADNAIGQKAIMGDMETAALLSRLREQSDLGLAGSGFSEDEYLRLLEKIAKMEDDLPDLSKEGFGVTVRGEYEVTVIFDHDEDGRNDLFEELAVRFPGQVRSMNL